MSIHLELEHGSWIYDIKTITNIWMLIYIKNMIYKKYGIQSLLFFRVMPSQADVWYILISFQVSIAKNYASAFRSSNGMSFSTRTTTTIKMNALLES